MPLHFNADEVLGIALAIERNGVDFYRRAAELEQGKPARAMLLELAAMEEEHQAVFSQMRQGLTADERKEMTYDPEGALPLYLQAMADKHVFEQKVEPSKRLTGKEDLEQILRLAIGMEKDSIVFYLGLQELVPERLGAAHVQEILKEEMGHLATLGDLLRCSGS